MTTTIAISGKGGSGKTTIAAMMIRYLTEQVGSGPVLAVDADPNSCVGLMLGVEPEGIIAEIREEARAKVPSNTGMDRLRTVEYGIQQAITEANGFDLLTMGRPEGPGCYCAANNILRTFLDKLSSQYRYVVIDNEAGMEHLSRRTTNNVDLLCIIAESTPIGLVTAERIFSLAKQLPISVRQVGVIWNKTPDNKKIKGIDILGHIPYDNTLFENSTRGKTIFELTDDNPAYLEVAKIIEQIFVSSF